MKWLRGGIIALVTVVLALACSDNGTGPKSVKYNVYAGSSYSTGGRSMDGALYILDADSLTILDSIPHMGQVDDIAVSPDGRWIYAECSWPFANRVLTKIDAKTLEKTEQLAVFSAGSLTLLDKGRLLLRQSSSCTSDLINPAGLQVTNTLSDSLCRMHGSVKGTKVAARIADERSRVRGTDVLSGAVFGTYTAHLTDGDTLMIETGVLHQDGRRVLLTATGKGHWFLIGDLETGETLLEYSLSWASDAHIALSDDGQYAAIAATGSTLFHDPFNVLQVFDLGPEQSLEWNDPLILCGKGKAQFHPDSRSIVLAWTRGYAFGGMQGPLQLVSVPEGTLLSELEAPFSQTEAGAIAIGPRP
jgi:hypothetical protein